MPNRNDPYSRPIHATQPHHARVLGLHGEPANRQTQVAVAAGNANAQLVHVAAPGTLPADWVSPPKVTRKRKATALNADVPPVEQLTVDVPPVEQLTVDESTITEDDLFG